LTSTDTTIFVNGKGYKVHVYKDGSDAHWVATGEYEGAEITVVADDALRAVINWKQTAQSAI